MLLHVTAVLVSGSGRHPEDFIPLQGLERFDVLKR